MPHAPPERQHAKPVIPQVGAGWAWAAAALLATLGTVGCASPATPPMRAGEAPCAPALDTGRVVDRAGLAGDLMAPEPASGYRVNNLVLAKTYMAVTANPHASQAGCEILRQGGSAVDAAVAAQMVLGLVEPQSSGLGGGAFMLHYDAKTGTVQSYDGRETAPAAATEDYLRFISPANPVPPLPVVGTLESGAAFNQLRQSGRSVGTPGVVRMLELAHHDHGRLPWATLFQAGRQLALDGFPVSARMADAMARSRTLLMTDPEAAAYFLDATGAAKPQGTLIKNPAYATTLSSLADAGADAFYAGSIAEGIVKKIKMTHGGNPSFAITPGLTDLSDLANYRAKRREPLCTTYRTYWVCGMGPPSSGGMAVAATLGVLENFDLAEFKPAALDVNGGKPVAMGVHLISEAQRLAYADRNRYIADTDFIALPGNSPAALLDKKYLRNRARLIDTQKSMGTAAAGTVTDSKGGSSDTEGNGTSHMTLVDAQGNVVVMTTSIESGMGSFRMTHGFLLNNQLTDFSVLPSNADGPIANRVQALKRPRSSMAPTLVFKKKDDGTRGDFVMATGSPGGPALIQYVTKTLVGVLDWGLDAQQATSMVDFGAANSPRTSVGGEHPNVDISTPAGGLAGGNDALVTGLRALGHAVSMAAQSSGVSTVVKTSHDGKTVLQGGADPRREGTALGDTLAR